MDDSPKKPDETRTVPDETQAPLVGREETGLHLDAAKLPEEMPDQPVASDEYGTTAREQADGEGLDRKLRREVPDDTVIAAAGVAPDEADVEDPDLAPPPQDDAGEDGYDDVKDLTADAGRDDGTSETSGRPQVPVPAEEDALHTYADVPGATDRRASPLDGIPDPDRP